MGRRRTPRKGLELTRSFRDRTGERVWHGEIAVRLYEEYGSARAVAEHALLEFGLLVSHSTVSQWINQGLAERQAGALRESVAGQVAERLVAAGIVGGEGGALDDDA